MGRYALLIGISNYTAGLDPLPSAVRDVAALRDVLVNPEIGCFAAPDVTVLQDARKGEIETAIHNLFANRKSDDLLLFYFSGHGVTDSNGNFYFSSVSTNSNALLPTAVSSVYVKNVMEQNGARSKRQVLILDCCHSGAFPKGMTKDDGTVRILPKLGGEGRAILTASDSTQYAFMQEGFELSLYTHFLVEGLKTGAADRDGDGEISVDELYEYVREKVKNANDNMSPEYHPLKGEAHKIILAKAALDDPRLKFRKEVEKKVAKYNGAPPDWSKNILVDKAQGLGLDSSEAEAIITEVLRPYVEYLIKLERYEEVLQNAITHRFPFTEAMQAELVDYEKHLGLRDQDIKAVRDRLITPKLLEVEQLKRQQKEAEYQQAILERTNNLARYKEEFQKAIEAAYPFDKYVRQGLNSFQQSLGLSDSDIESIERPLIEVEDSAYWQKQEAADKLKQSQNNNQSKFKYEFVKVLAVKEGGFLGLGSSTRIKQTRHQGKAKYIRENIGNNQAIEFVHIPAGKFMMGSNESGSEKPIHEVNIKSFWLGKYTVTNTQWEAVMGAKGSVNCDVKFQGKNQPLVGVSLDNFKEFCERISKQMGKNVRLPSEAEWEYACRAGTTTPFHFGETITPDLVNYNGDYPYGNAPKGEYREKTVNVASFNPNPWGLYQMHGNVWEWCEDVWHENYNHAPTDGTAWLEGGEQNKRVLRGGSWSYNTSYCRSAYRIWYLAGGGRYDFGFRVVLS